MRRVAGEKKPNLEFQSLNVRNLMVQLQHLLHRWQLVVRPLCASMLSRYQSAPTLANSLKSIVSF